MFYAATLDSQATISNLERMLRASRRLQNALAKANRKTSVPTDIAHAAKLFPPNTSIRQFEHAATILQLYSAYEACVVSLVRTWLRDLPNVVTGYAELGKSFEHIHRVGIAKVLTSIDHQRFSHLSPDVVSLSYSECVAGHSCFEVLPEAFLGENRTYKKDRLTELMSHLCLGYDWNAIEADDRIQQVLALDFGGSETAESALRAFISYRNDAAHGRSSQILGYNDLRGVIRFVQAMCAALTDTFSRGRARLLINNKKIVEIGCVVDVLPRKGVGIVDVKSCSLQKGDELFFFNASTIVVAYIVEMKNDDQFFTTLQVSSRLEVGLKLTSLPKKKMIVGKLAQ
jgi:hypothetical protein